MSGGLKGHPVTARGIAPGAGWPRGQALKGRHELTATPVEAVNRVAVRFRPYRA